jgi:HEPN domain-containing protein
MPPELAVEISEWCRKAEIDLGAARTLLGPERSYPSVAVFLCQQAAEKMRKAYLTWRATPFAPVHDLRRLCELCAAHDATFAELREAAEVLTPYAVAVRYPGQGPEPTLEEAQSAERLAASVVHFVRTRLPSRASP